LTSSPEGGGNPSSPRPPPTGDGDPHVTLDDAGVGQARHVSATAKRSAPCPDRRETSPVVNRRSGQRIALCFHAGGASCPPWLSGTSNGRTLLGRRRGCPDFTPTLDRGPRLRGQPHSEARLARHPFWPAQT
jgi:hypothetical protein